LKARLKILMLVATLLLACTAISAAYAQTSTTSEPVLPSWLTWDALVVYAAIGAFFGWLHDFNDHQNQIILPHKVANGTWDLGIITPLLLGAISGFLALAALNTPILSGVLPTLNGQYPGVIAAAFAGYFYTRTIQTASSLITTANTASTAAPSTPAPSDTTVKVTILDAITKKPLAGAYFSTWSAHGLLTAYTDSNCNASILIAGGVPVLKWEAKAQGYITTSALGSPPPQILMPAAA